MFWVCWPYSVATTPLCSCRMEAATGDVQRVSVAVPVKPYLHKQVAGLRAVVSQPLV